MKLRSLIIFLFLGLSASVQAQENVYGEVFWINSSDSVHDGVCFYNEQTLGYFVRKSDTLFLANFNYTVDSEGMVHCTNQSKGASEFFQFYKADSLKNMPNKSYYGSQTFFMIQREKELYVQHMDHQIYINDAPVCYLGVLSDIHMENYPENGDVQLVMRSGLFGETGMMNIKPSLFKGQGKLWVVETAYPHFFFNENVAFSSSFTVKSVPALRIVSEGVIDVKNDKYCDIN